MWYMVIIDSQRYIKLTLVQPLITDIMFLQTGNKIKMTLKLIGKAGALAKANAS